MINKIILFSIKNKLLIGLMMLAWVGAGIYSMNIVAVDAVPDITNNQVQVITVSPNLGTEDIEQLKTELFNSTTNMLNFLTKNTDFRAVHPFFGELTRVLLTLSCNTGMRSRNDSISACFLDKSELALASLCITRISSILDSAPCSTRGFKMSNSSLIRSKEIRSELISSFRLLSCFRDASSSEP